MRLGRGVWQCITGGEVLVDLLTDCLELALFELGDADAAPAFGGADQCRIDQLQDGALAEACGITLVRRRSSPNSRSNRLVVRIARRWPSGKRSCAMQASKSSSRQATALGRSRP